MDPPDLIKRRRVMSHAFTPRAIGKLEEGIRARAATIIDNLIAAGGGDWIGDVADVLPMSVIGDIIGIPDEDRPEIFDTLDRILSANSPDSQLTERDQLETVRQDLRLCVRAHCGEAAQSCRRHLEHPGVRSGHRRER